MGFRTGAFAKVWEVTPVSDTGTKLRVSISKKNKQTDEYEQEFSGFIFAVGSATARKAASLKEGDRIKLGDVDVSTKYDKEKGVTYTNYKVFSFDADDNSPRTSPHDDPQPVVDDVDFEDSRLPY